MDCLWVREHLESYLGGETSDELAGQISEHLLGCDGCRDQAMQLEALTQRLRELPSRIVPQDRLAPAPATPLRPRRRRLLLVAVAVLAAWAAASGVLLVSTAGLRSENAELQRQLDERAALPVGALTAVQTLFAGGRTETASGLPAGLERALAGASEQEVRSVRVTSVDAVQALPGAGLRLRLHVEVRYTDAITPESKTLSVDLRRLPDGGWQVTRVGTP